MFTAPQARRMRCPFRDKGATPLMKCKANGCMAWHWVTPESEGQFKRRGVCVRARPYGQSNFPDYESVPVGQESGYCDGQLIENMDCGLIGAFDGDCLIGDGKPAVVVTVDDDFLIETYTVWPLDFCRPYILPELIDAARESWAALAPLLPAELVGDERYARFSRVIDHLARWQSDRTNYGSCAVSSVGGRHVS